MLRYLGHTKNYAIVFNAETNDPRKIFLASSDSAYGDDSETRRSSYGYGFKLFNGMIHWKASKGNTVTTSSTEAELLALSSTAKETLWWTRFFEAIRLNLPFETNIECDNMQTIQVLTPSGATQYTTKLRHIDIHHHWLRQEVANKKVHVQWTPTSKILADGLTKALSPQRHEQFVKLLGLESDAPVIHPPAGSGGSGLSPSKTEGIHPEGVCQPAGIEQDIGV